MGAEPDVPLAARRQKRGLASSVSPAPDGSVAKRSRPVNGGVVGGIPRGSSVGGKGFEGAEFLCRGCKMAARRAVRQYGLLGSLETGGLVLPYGESDVRFGFGVF